MSTIIGTTLNADTIRKTGGSLGTDIRIKNTSVYESDGGTSVTQNLVQCLPKAWMHLNGTGTIAIQDSINVSSVTDVSAGNYTQTHTNAMGNALYSVQLMNNRSTSTNNSTQQHIDSTFTSALFNIMLVRHDNLASEDSARVMTTANGDLA